MSDRLSLIDYAQLKYRCQRKKFIVLPHIELMFHYLELVFIGGLPDGKKNLLINIPPRHGKTEAINTFTEWALGLVPDSEFITSSYAFKLAMKNTMAIRATMIQEWYQRVFPACRLDGALQQAWFETSAGGHVFAAGGTGSVTGYGAGKLRKGFGGALVIDDPIKPDDAKSATGVMIENAQAIYADTLKTRRNSENTPTIMIMQRLHPNDPSGYVLTEEYEEWFHLKIPVFNDDGSLIWPGRISPRELEKEKEVNPFKFYGQYMQEPTTPGGSVIKNEWWHYYTDLEEVVKRCNLIVIFGDTATKKQEANDYSVFQAWGFEGAKRAYLLDQLRGKWEFPELIKAFRAIWDKWQNHPLGKNARMAFIEDKSSGTQLVQFEKEKIPIEPWVPSEFDAPDDKISQVQNAAFMIWGGEAWLPDPDIEIDGHKPFAWVRDEFLPECAFFRADDSHSHDDQVDIAAKALLTWRSMGGGKALDEIKDD